MGHGRSQNRRTYSSAKRRIEATCDYYLHATSSLCRDVDGRHKVILTDAVYCKVTLEANCMLSHTAAGGNERIVLTRPQVDFRLVVSTSRSTCRAYRISFTGGRAG